VKYGLEPPSQLADTFAPGDPSPLPFDLGPRLPRPVAGDGPAAESA
jgi:hypothetical protein